MSDLEQRLTEVLARGAEDAPPATGLAAGARRRARQRRRARLAGAGAVLALAVGVPTALVVADGGDSRPSPRDHDAATDPAPAPTSTTDVVGPGTPAADGYRWESWHGVTIEVPDGWAYGSRSAWCADDGALEPVVERPGGIVPMILCDPGSTYGLTFQEIDHRDDFQWPIVHQNGSGWPEENVVGARGIGGVLAEVATRTEPEAAAVLDSMRAIGPDGDPNGCLARMLPGANNPPEGTLSICRYDPDGALEQSEALVGEDAGDAVRALQAAPEAGECADTSTGGQPHGVVLLEASGTTARVDLVPECPRVTVDGDVRELTSDVLYWALSPGWSGDGTNLPLPPEPRQQ